MVDNLILGWLVKNGCRGTFAKIPASIAYRDGNTDSLDGRYRKFIEVVLWWF